MTNPAIRNRITLDLDPVSKKIIKKYNDESGISNPIKVDLSNIDMIILLGRKGVGKDTFGNYLSKKINWNTYALAKPLKDIVSAGFGLTDEQLNDPQKKEEVDSNWNLTPRHIMQIVYKNLFTDALSSAIPEIGEKFFAIHFEKIYAKNNSPNVIITDMRNPTYINYFKTKYRCLVIKITRFVLIRDDHCSEQEVDSYHDYDYLIENNELIHEFYRTIDLMFD